MSSRLRNLLLAFGVSLTMWAGIIHGAVLIYASLQPGPEIVAAANS